MHTCNPSTQKVMTRGSGDQGYPWLHSFQPSLGSKRLRKKRKSVSSGAVPGIAENWPSASHGASGFIHGLRAFLAWPRDAIVFVCLTGGPADSSEHSTCQGWSALRV